MKMADVLSSLPFWAFGLFWVFFPAQVLRFYRWFLGPHAMKGTEQRHIRNAGVLWLIVMAGVTYAILTTR